MPRAGSQRADWQLLDGSLSFIFEFPFQSISLFFFNYLVARDEQANYCPSGASVQTPCDAGAYCLTVGLSAPTANCSAGSFCPPSSSNFTLCVAGAYCSVTGLSAPDGNCSSGYYCPTGASQPILWCVVLMRSFEPILLLISCSTCLFLSLCFGLCSARKVHIAPTAWVLQLPHQTALTVPPRV